MQNFKKIAPIVCLPGGCTSYNASKPVQCTVYMSFDTPTMNVITRLRALSTLIIVLICRRDGGTVVEG